MWIFATDPLASLRQWQAHDSAVAALAFSPCGTYMATASGNIGAVNSVRVWSLDAENLAEQPSEDEAVESVCFSRDGETLFWGDYGGLIEGWKWRSGESRRLRDQTDSPASALALLGDDLLLCGVGGAFHPEPVEVWNLATGILERRLHGHLFGVGDLAVFPGTRRFVSAGDSTLRIWDLGMRAETRVEFIEPEVTWTGFRQAEIITADEESKTAWVRSLQDGVLIRKFDGHDHTVSAVAISGDDRRIACGLTDGTVQVYHAAGGRRLWSCKQHKAEVTALAFTDDGELLATAGNDGVLALLHGGTGEPAHASKHSRDEGVHNLAFSHSGSLIAVGTYSYLRLLQVATPKRLLTLKNVTHYRLWFAPADDFLIVETPGQLGAAWHISTKQQVPEGPELQALYDAAMLRAGQRWQWHSPGNLGYAQEYLKLVDTHTGSVVAAYPELQGRIKWHPGGRVWSNQRSRRLTVIRLEG